jgi:adenylate cyclase
LLTNRINKKKKRFFQGLATALLIGLICCLISYFQLFHTLEQQSNDLLYRGQESNYPSDTSQKIVIVAIDDASLAELGRFSSWPRTRYTELVDFLNKSQARIIAFDILFSEASPDDAGLAAAIKSAGNVILPYAGTAGSDGTGGSSLIKPLPIFEASALATGHAFMAPDDDGVLRKLPVLLPQDSGYAASLALTTVSKYLRRAQVYDSLPDGKHLAMAGREIPLQDYGMLINYADNPAAGAFKTVPFADVLRGAVSPDVFKDKIVLVGITALGFGDTYWTPMGRALSGVEIHANAVGTILSGHFLRPASPLVMYTSIMLLALICGLAVSRFRVIWSALSIVFLCLAYFMCAFYFFGQGRLLDIFYPPLSLVLAFIGVNLYHVTMERREKGEIARTFGRYVSPSVATKILSTVNEGSLELGGEECPVTVLFADARNFTGFCEKTGPHMLVSTLNRYLSVIIEAILKHNGMVNKFGGDSIMAVWNAPIVCPEHALYAVKAAVKAQEEISALQANIPDLPRMEFGIGINSGRAIAGNMGSLERLEYSLIGDTVNTAARLSAVAPGGRVWTGTGTFEYVQTHFEMVPLGPLMLKGKGELIYAYEVSLGQSMPDPSPPAPVKTVKALV